MCCERTGIRALLALLMSGATWGSIASADEAGGPKLNLLDLRAADGQPLGGLSGSDRVSDLDFAVRQVFTIEATDSDGGSCAAALDREVLRQSQTLLVCGDEEVSRGIKIKSMESETGFGRVDFYASIGKLATVDAPTISKMLFDDFEQTKENTALSIGFVNRLFDDRLTLGSDFSHAHDASTWREKSEESSFSSSQDRHGSARWHRFEAKIIDSTNLRWYASGEMSSIDVGYGANSSARPSLALSLPGERLRLSSFLDIDDVSVSGLMEHYDGPLQTRVFNLVKFGIAGADVRFSTRNVDRSSPLQPDLRLSRSVSSSVGLEVMPELLLPGLLTGLGEIQPIVPSLLTVDWERGEDASYFGGVETQGIKGLQALLTWSGRLGETTALYWREDQTPIGAEEEAQTGSDELLDLSHSYKVGHWSFTAGISLFDVHSQSQANGYSDTSVSGTFSISYTAPNGPEFRAGLGHSRGEFAFEDDFGREESGENGLSLSASLDLTKFMQEYFDRPNLKFHAEYRRNLNETSSSTLNSKETEREAFLLHFRASL